MARVFSWIATAICAIYVVAALLAALIALWHGLAVAVLEVPVAWRYALPIILVFIPLAVYLNDEMVFDRWWVTALAALLGAALVVFALTMLLGWISQLDAAALDWLSDVVRQRWPWLAGIFGIAVLLSLLSLVLKSTAARLLESQSNAEPPVKRPLDTYREWLENQANVTRK